MPHISRLFTIAAVALTQVNCSNDSSKIPDQAGHSEKPALVTHAQQAAVELGVPPTNITTETLEDLNWQIETQAVQFADGGVTVNLLASVSGDTELITQTVWTQTQGTAAAIYSPYENTTQVLIPNTEAPEDIEFRFSAVDITGHTQSVLSRVKVLPQTTPGSKINSPSV